MSSRTILIATDVDGDFSYERPFFGLIRGVLLDVGDLDTGALDVILSDATRSVVLHEFGELSGDAYWTPDPPVPVYGTISVVVSAGGNTKHGSVRMMTET